MSCAKLANNEYDMKIGEGPRKGGLLELQTGGRSEWFIICMPCGTPPGSWQRKKGMSDAIECERTGVRMIVEMTRGGKKTNNKRERSKRGK